ncbi:cytochrome c oxidase subunit II [Stigmatella sp. ncwal1]|uniref:Cytochrome c oxidase subunit II n=1 Tax=Stigmatella ashevillensis TaxID=2995309 RepID=A0ABT5DFC1_9BACT|nr:cytochrome c oxidase subunit II [Stigmatella ashevillena]MDC0712191.1 cytochrome c oxidase subunit II [Stigmatella ashevillena]
MGGLEGGARYSSGGVVTGQAHTLALPENASAHGHRIDALLASSHFLEAVLAAVMLGWLVLAVWRFRNAPPTAVDGGTRRSRRWVMALALAAVGVVDGTLFVRSLGYLDEVLWNFGPPMKHPDTVRLELNAHQWAWEARYAGEDGHFGTADDVVTWNDVRVPVGVPVWVQLASTDVVHGFSLPNFRVKLDAVPGRVNQTWFQAAREGVWEVACYQHCGTSHYKMRGELTVMTPEAYAAWLREASRQAVQAYDAADAAAHWGWEWRAAP